MRRKIGFLLLSAILCLCIGIAYTIENVQQIPSVRVEEINDETDDNNNNNDNNEDYEDDEDNNNWDDVPEDYNRRFQRYHHNNKNPKVFCEKLNNHCQEAGIAPAPTAPSRSNLRRDGPSPIVSNVTQLCDEQTCIAYVENHRCFIDCAKDCYKEHKDDEQAKLQCKQGCLPCVDPEKPDRRSSRRIEYQHNVQYENPAVTGHGPRPQDYCEVLGDMCEANGRRNFVPSRIAKEDLCDHTTCVDWMASHRCFMPCMHSCMEDNQDNKDAANDCIDNTCYSCEDKVSKNMIEESQKQHAVEDSEERRQEENNTEPSPEGNNGLAAPADGPRGIAGNHPHHGGEGGHHGGGQGMHNQPDPERLCHKIAEGCLINEAKGDDNNNRFRRITKEALCDQAACVAFMTTHQCFSQCAHQCHEDHKDKGDEAIDACIEGNCLNCQDVVPADSPAALRQAEMAPGPVDGSEGHGPDHHHGLGSSENNEPDVARTCHRIHEGCVAKQLDEMDDNNDDEDDNDDDDNNRFRRITKDDLCNQAACVAFMTTHKCYTPCAHKCNEDHGVDQALVDACIESQCLNCQDDTAVATPPSRRFAKIARHSAQIRRIRRERSRFASSLRQPDQGPDHHHGLGSQEGGAPDINRTCHKIAEGCFVKDLDHTKDIFEGDDNDNDDDDDNNRRFRRRGRGRRERERRRITKQDLCDQATCVEFMTTHTCFIPCAQKCHSDHNGDDELIDACMQGNCFNCQDGVPPPARHFAKIAKHSSQIRRRRQAGTRHVSVARQDNNNTHPPQHHHGEGSQEGGAPDIDRTCHKIHEGCVAKELGNHDDNNNNNDDNNNENNNNDDNNRRRIAKQDLCDPAICVAFMTTHKCYSPCAQKCNDDHGVDQALVDACIESECLTCQDVPPPTLRHHGNESEHALGRRKIIKRNHLHS